MHDGHVPCSTDSTGGTVSRFESGLSQYGVVFQVMEVHLRAEPLTADETHAIRYWTRACRRVRKAIRNMTGRDVFLTVPLAFGRLLDAALYRYCLALDTTGFWYDNPYAIMYPEGYHSSAAFQLDGMKVYIGNRIEICAEREA